MQPECDPCEANPISTFQGGSNCDIDSHFKDQQIVFDSTFCGDWAGREWSKDNVCSVKAPTCEEYVKNNPKAFTEAFWTIKALKVYNFDGSSTPSASIQQPEPSNPVSISVQQPSATDSSQRDQQPTPSISTSTSIQQSSPTASSNVPMVTSYIDGGPVTVTVDPGSKVTQLVVGEPVTVTLAPGVPLPQLKQVRQEEALPQFGEEHGRTANHSRSVESRGQRRRSWRVRRHLAEHLRKHE